MLGALGGVVGGVVGSLLDPVQALLDPVLAIISATTSAVSMLTTTIPAVSTLFSAITPLLTLTTMSAQAIVDALVNILDALVTVLIRLLGVSSALCPPPTLVSSLTAALLSLCEELAALVMHVLESLVAVVSAVGVTVATSSSNILLSSTIYNRAQFNGSSYPSPELARLAPEITAFSTFRFPRDIFSTATSSRVQVAVVQLKDSFANTTCTGFSADTPTSVAPVLVARAKGFTKTGIANALPGSNITYTLVLGAHTNQVKAQVAANNNVTVANMLDFNSTSPDPHTGEFTVEYKLLSGATSTHVAEQANYVCGWLEPNTGLWSTEGCVFVESSNETTSITCSCNHLTSFSVGAAVHVVAVSSLRYSLPRFAGADVVVQVHARHTEKSNTASNDPKPYC